jgi:hypothetical protein
MQQHCCSTCSWLQGAEDTVNMYAVIVWHIWRAQIGHRNAAECKQQTTYAGNAIRNQAGQLQMHKESPYCQSRHIAQHLSLKEQ